MAVNLLKSQACTRTLFLIGAGYDTHKQLLEYRALIEPEASYGNLNAQIHHLLKPKKGAAESRWYLENIGPNQRNNQKRYSVAWDNLAKDLFDFVQEVFSTAKDRNPYKPVNSRNAKARAEFKVKDLDNARRSSITFRESIAPKNNFIAGIVDLAEKSAASIGELGSSWIQANKGDVHELFVLMLKEYARSVPTELLMRFTLTDHFYHLLDELGRELFQHEEYGAELFNIESKELGEDLLLTFMIYYMLAQRPLWSRMTSFLERYKEQEERKSILKKQVSQGDTATNRTSTAHFFPKYAENVLSPVSTSDGD